MPALTADRYWNRVPRVAGSLLLWMFSSIELIAICRVAMLDWRKSYSFALFAFAVNSSHLPWILFVMIVWRLLRHVIQKSCRGPRFDLCLWFLSSRGLALICFTTWQCLWPISTVTETVTWVVLEMFDLTVTVTCINLSGVKCWTVTVTQRIVCDQFASARNLGNEDSTDLGRAASVWLFARSSQLVWVSQGLTEIDQSTVNKLNMSPESWVWSGTFMSCLYVRWQLCCFWQLMLWSDGAVKAKAMGAKHGPSGLGHWCEVWQASPAWKGDDARLPEKTLDTI